MATTRLAVTGVVLPIAPCSFAISPCETEPAFLLPNVGMTSFVR